MTENEAMEVLETIYEKYVRDCNSEDEYMKQNFAISEAVKALSEIRQYRAIGAVEECRKARERQIPKKPTLYGDFEDGKLLCPNCEEDLMDLTECGFNCCPYCGQAIVFPE